MTVFTKTETREEALHVSQMTSWKHFLFALIAGVPSTRYMQLVLSCLQRHTQLLAMQHFISESQHEHTPSHACLPAFKGALS